ncbi:MAG: NnrS family protein, partial [Gammaproteobacteria bacterium]|nr:NnrS family protein [Gammaproteobacteria bacterium]
ILAGRVMPFFTKAVLPGFKPIRWAWAEWGSTLSMLGLILLQLLYPQQSVISLLALASAVTLGLRVYGWYDRRIWRIPMLWILFCAIFWVIAGLLMVALSLVAPALTSTATHALTVGGIGIMTLGMMSRVALGHTGRSLEPNIATVLAFALLNLGALIRVCGPLVLPQNYFITIHLSSGLWSLAFLLFSIVYLPILLKPRIDGKPG